MTKGYRSTEFWLTFAAFLVGALIASGLLGEGSTALKIATFIAGTLATLGYAGFRTSLKKKASKG